MNNGAIGVFDSGLGGLTTVKELNRLLPNEEVVYLGDTARVPYGARSKSTIAKYAMEDFAFLEKMNVKMIIVACGTVSAIMQSNNNVTSSITNTGVLLPAVQSACASTKNNKIGVIGTSATVKSGAYGKAIRAINGDIVVVGKACPMFVPLVENGYFDKNCEVAKIIAREYLQIMIDEKVDTLILGCTHYPLLTDIIREIMGDEVTLINPGEEAAKFALGYLSQNEMLSDSEGIASNHYYVTDSVELFSENAGAFLGESIVGKVASVTLGE